MPAHAKKLNTLDAAQIEVHLSRDVQQALSDLEAAVHFSEHFDGDIRDILGDWAKGKHPTIHEVLTAFPLIAEETSEHVRMTNDIRAQEAWRELCLKMPERGFELQKRVIRKQASPD
jgi:hypothetical protein